MVAVWRNEKAELRKAQSWEAERLKRLEEIQYNVEKEFEKQLAEKQQRKSFLNVRKSEISSITSAETLHEMLIHSNDPDSIMVHIYFHFCAIVAIPFHNFKEMLSASQQLSVIEFRRRLSSEHQQNMSSKVKEAINKSKLVHREVVPILKLVVVDVTDYGEKDIVFNVWKPSDELLNILKEGYVFSVYNVIPK